MLSNLYKHATSATGLLWAASIAVRAEVTSPYRGLWVGDVSVSYVNQVTIPLDQNNNPVAPDPKVPTPTADIAHLRLIIHVNGAGQASLLRQVAVLNRVAPASVGDGTKIVDYIKDSSSLIPGVAGISSEKDISLVTDESLYGEFPKQQAFRVASAVFEFGDSKPTEVLNSLLTAVSDSAGNSVNSVPAASFTTPDQRGVAQEAARVSGLNAGSGVLQTADATSRFTSFLSSNLKSADVTAIASAPNPATASATVTALGAAVTLRDSSAFGDARPVNMVNAVVAAVQSVSLLTDKIQTAQNTAASYADIQNGYGRFLAGKIFGDMIAGGAESAANMAVAPGATIATIRSTVDGTAAVVAARSQALALGSLSPYTDTRSRDAVEAVINQLVSSASAVLPATATASALRTSVEAAARSYLVNNVPRYAVPVVAPSLQYDAFVASTGFQGSASLAATTAAAAAVSERANNALYTLQSIRDAAKLAAVQALRDVFSAASSAQSVALPLPDGGGGGFGPGKGDSRLTWDIKQNRLPTLSPGALVGTIFLPSSHPTNPFRHRRHPDHAIGFDLTRKLRFDFDGTAGSPLLPAGFGVQKLTGTYREEVFGLHKPLGPNPATDPVGLRVEGKFELNRISLIDTLNAR